MAGHGRIKLRPGTFDDACWIGISRGPNMPKSVCSAGAAFSTVSSVAARLVRALFARRAACIDGLVGLALLGVDPAFAEVHLELRIVPQNGQPGEPGGVVSLDSDRHPAFTAVGQKRRFEVQFRVVTD